MLYKGLLLMIIGLYFFIKGLDDDNDYLKMNHGMWHVFSAIGMFHLY
jgi:predicted membrane channel-forming protein YqfA (hemolysin III family)